MKIIYENLGIIIGFSIIIILIQNFIGEKASEAMVLIALLSVVLVNSDNITKFLGQKEI